MMLRTAAAAALALGIAVPAANAGITFEVVDATATVTDNAPLATLSATPVAGLIGTTFTLGGLGDSETFDFLKWTATGLLGGTYNVSATLKFNPPTGADTTGGGGGVFATLGGIVSGGTLFWNSGVPNTVKVGNNVFATIDFQDGFTIAGPKGVTSKATVRISAVPIPATAALSLLGIAGFAGYRRVQKSKRAA